MTEQEIKEFCEVSYCNDLQVMLDHYNHALNKAKNKNNLKQVSLFSREIYTIEQMIINERNREDA